MFRFIKKQYSKYERKIRKYFWWWLVFNILKYGLVFFAYEYIKKYFQEIKEFLFF